MKVGVSNVLFITTYSCMVYQCNASEDYPNPSDDVRISPEYKGRGQLDGVGEVPQAQKVMQNKYKCQGRHISSKSFLSVT